MGFIRRELFSSSDPDGFQRYVSAIVEMGKKGMFSRARFARFSNHQGTWVSPPAFNEQDGALGWADNAEFEFYPLAKFMEEKADSRGYYLYRFPALSLQELVQIRQQVEPFFVAD